MVAIAIRKTRHALGQKQIPLMGIMAAFIFAAQMINFPVAGGTSGHLLGGALAAIGLGPWPAVLVMTAVVSVQGLLFQDGGLLAMGVFLEIFPEMDETGIQYLEDMIRLVDPEFVKVLLEDRFFEDLNVPAMLEKVTCPTLLLYGELDKGAVVRDRDVEFFLYHVSKGTAIQIKNAGHLLQIDQPSRVLELIEEFTANLQ